MAKYGVISGPYFLYSTWIPRFKFPYSVRIQENTDQKQPEFGHFSRSARIDCGFKSMWFSCNWIAQTIWECQMSISIKYLHVILFIEKIEAVVQKYSVKKVFLNILQSSQETPVPEACNFIKHEALAQVFSCRFCDMFKKTFFNEHFRATASLSYSLKRYFPENFPSFAEQLSEATV